MANTITQRIQLVGGDEIRVQFESLGEAGRTAFRRIQDAASAAQTIDRLGPTIDSIKAKAQALSVAGKRLGDDFRNLGTRVSDSARDIAVVGGAVTGAIVGFGALVIRAGAATDALNDTAAAIGLTAKELQNLSFGAGQSGIEEGKFAGLLGKLNRAMGDSQKQALETQKKQGDLSDQFVKNKVTAADYLESSLKITKDASEQINAFTRLGVATHNADGSLRNTRLTLLDIADAFKDMPNGAEKSALAIDLFGRGGERMVQFLNEGSAGITRLEREAERLAPALSKLELQIGGRLDDAFDALSKSVGSVRNSILLTFAPATTRLVTALTEFIANNRSAWIKWASDIAAKVTPVVNDIVALIEGRDKDVKNTFVIRARDAFVEFANAAQRAITDIILPAIAGLIGVLNVLATAINAVFGTSLSGQEIAIVLVVTKLIGLFGVLGGVVNVVVSAIGLLAAAFGGVNVILIALGVAFGVFVVNSIGGIRGIQDAWTNTWNAVLAVGQGMFDTLASVARTFADGLAAIWGAFVTATQIAASAIVGVFSGALDTVKGFFNSLYDDVVNVFKKIVEGAKIVGQAMRAAFSGSGDTGPTQGFAGGGHVRGPGSSTSDSIWARLSDFEYVQRAAAVRKYGVDFMNAINGLRLPVESVRSLMSGIDVGSVASNLTGSLTPRYAFADGGLAVAPGGASGALPVNLHFPGLSVPAFMSGDAIGQLRKFASTSELRSSGRKPSWFRS